MSDEARRAAQITDLKVKALEAARETPKFTTIEEILELLDQCVIKQLRLKGYKL